MTQDHALTILKTGANVFLTGEPGSGKTHTINRYVRYLRDHDIEPAITASTGIAATHIGGMTIHSWSGIGIKRQLSEYDLDYLTTNEYLVKRVGKAKVLIIDEISMLSADTFIMVDQVCRVIRRSELPFGGLQVIVVGDFFQLPPISSFGQKALFAFECSSWRAMEPIVCYLHEQHRQDDKEFLSVLSAMRSNSLQQKHRDHITARSTDYDDIVDGVTKLFPHNADVDRLNDEELARLHGVHTSFSMMTQGKDVLVDALKKGCLSPEQLILKEGAVVMFTKNNPVAGFANGTLGIVTGFERETRYPIVRTHTGAKITAAPVEWAVEEDGKVKARISQVPLRLAWAITVHKSQGMSLDAAIIDLAAAFEYGQGYVALSRVRRLSGLYLLGCNERALMVHPEILRVEELFRESSKVAETTFGQMDSDTLKKMHENFILASNGVLMKGKKKSGKTLSEVRKNHPKAGAKWSDEEEAELIVLFESGKGFEEIGKVLGRKPGGVTMRLKKLGLIEE